MDAVILGIQDTCADFHHIAFTHVGCQGNKSAHLLAKYAKGIDDVSVWIEEIPCVIEQALIHDVILHFYSLTSWYYIFLPWKSVSSKKISTNTTGCR